MSEKEVQASRIAGAYHEETLESALGLYFTNLGLIRLRRDVSVFSTSNEPTPLRFGVFLHEYLHYLHNFSTVAGIYGFAAFLRLLKVFANTVGVTGRSYGDSVLHEEAQREWRAAAAWAIHLRGEPKQAPLWRRLPADANLRFHSFDVKPTVIAFPVQELNVYGVTVRFLTSIGDQEQALDLDLGAHVLMEGLAHEAESIYLSRCGMPPITSGDIPTYPYRIARIIFEHFTGPCVESGILSRYLLNALQSSEPGEAFLSFAREHGKLIQAGMGEREALAYLTSKAQSALQVVASSIIERTIDLEIGALRRRGLAGRGFGQMAEWCRSYLSIRLHRPHFELDALDAVSPVDAIYALLEQLPPCTILSELDDDTDELLLFGKDAGFDSDLGAAQAMIQFAYAHLAASRIVPSTEASRKCTFFGSCRAPLRQEHPGVCLTKPWELFDPGAREHCWFSLGVASARARSDLA